MRKSKKLSKSDARTGLGPVEPDDGFEERADKQPKGHAVQNALFSVAVVSAAAAFGAASTDTTSRWYRKLAKPAWQPAPEVFPIAWTTLYALTAAASTGVLTRLRRAGKADQAGEYRRSLVTNMAINAAWPYVFFEKQELGAGSVVAAALAVSSAELARKAGKAGGLCGLAMLPYAAWTAFATGLSSSIWLENRDG